jgi:hypothetical protein
MARLTCPFDLPVNALHQAASTRSAIARFSGIFAGIHAAAQSRGTNARSPLKRHSALLHRQAKAATACDVNVRAGAFALLEHREFRLASKRLSTPVTR